MVRIAELNRNSFFNKLYQPSAVQTLNSTNPDLYQLDIRPGSLKVLSSLSLSNFQNKQEEYRQNITEFTSSVKDMGTGAKTLQDASYYSKAYVQSGSAAVTGETKAGATTAQYSVGVTQKAAAQRNESVSVQGSAYGAISSGSHTFGLTVGSAGEKQLSVNIAATDTNEQALQKFANAINYSKSGVKAEVKTAAGKQFLALQGESTGVVNAYTLKDINGTAVNALHLNNATQTAMDAKYTINGQNYQSASNDVKLDNGKVTLHLQAVTNGAVKVNVGKDDTQVVNAVKELAAQYNRVNTVLTDSGEVTSRGSKLLDGVKNLVDKTRRSDLSAMGITLNKESGELQVDADKLQSALSSKPERVRSAVSSLARAAGNVVQVTSHTAASSYLKPPSPLDSIDYGSAFASNSWLQQSRQVAQGMFLDVSV